MKVSDVIDNVSADIRQVLSSSGTEASLLITWTDQIHKNALHTSLYNYLLKNMGTFSTTSGTSAYSVSTGNDDPRRLTMVYDRTFERVIPPIENLTAPSPLAEDLPHQPLAVPKPALNAITSEQWPQYYYQISTSTAHTIKLALFPAPQKSALLGTYEIYYEKQVGDLSEATDDLVIPSDGMDLVVAGVNMRAATYLKIGSDISFWTQQYEMLKKGIV